MPGFTMMTSSSGNIFRVTDHLREEFTSPGEFPAQRPVKRSFDVFFDLRLNKRLSKQSWGWWLVAKWHPQWCQCSDFIFARYINVGTKWHFKDNVYKCIFWNENCHILTQMLQRFVPKDPIDKGQNRLPGLLVAYSARSHYMNFYLLRSLYMLDIP